MWVVVRDGVSLGLITKIPNDSTTVNPWKAFHGLGWGQKFLGSFYGSQGSAVQAVVLSHNQPQPAKRAPRRRKQLAALAILWENKPCNL